VRIWRGGMIGAGAWSGVQLSAWSRVANAQIVALSDRHQDRRELAQRRFDIPGGFADPAEMLRQVELDFVDVCSRPSSHAGLVRLGADRGLPVLCQKPFCTSLEEARAVVEYCEGAGVRLMVNENYRWQSWYRTAKDVLASGALGTPFCAVIQERARLTLPQFDHNQTYLAEMPRLIVYELGTHHFDVMRFLFGEPKTVYARLQKVSRHMAGEDVAHITLGYPALTAAISASWASVRPCADVSAPSMVPRFEIDGTEGTLALCEGRSLGLFRDAERKTFPVTGDVSDSQVAAQKHFVDCLETGAEFETSGRDALATMALVYQAYRSSDESQVVAGTS